ncbi:MAG TPA: hypothetical protein VFV86_12565 [Nitrososphaeraceae archaeon]|nr:hypothetical protein [Nitrososphaeraceae archaeon]
MTITLPIRWQDENSQQVWNNDMVSAYQKGTMILGSEVITSGNVFKLDTSIGLRLSPTFEGNWRLWGRLLIGSSPPAPSFLYNMIDLSGFCSKNKISFQNMSLPSMLIVQTSSGLTPQDTYGYSLIIGNIIKLQASEVSGFLVNNSLDFDVGLYVN